MLSVTADKPTPICIKSIEATKMDLCFRKSSTVNVMTPLIQIGVAPSKRGLKHVFSHFLLLYIFRVLLVFIKCDKCVHLWHQLLFICPPAGTTSVLLI